MVFLYDNEKISEKEIQTLYENHPYLIEKKFLNQKIISQFPLPSGFADIVMLLKDETVIIELKVDPLEVNHLLQLNGYLEDIKKELKDDHRIRGILIGKEPKKDLNNILMCLSFEIKIMILEKELCTKIKICENCRLANDINSISCIYCFNKSFF